MDRSEEGFSDRAQKIFNDAVILKQPTWDEMVFFVRMRNAAAADVAVVLLRTSRMSFFICL